MFAIFIILLTKSLLVHGQQQPQCECLLAQKGQPLVMNAQPVENQNIGDACFANYNFDCDPNSFYRYIDGRCNNAVHLSWGMTNNTILRLLPAVYSQNPQDPPESLRVSSIDNTTPLQSPRVLSNVFFTDHSFPSEKYTEAFMLLGQVMAHDVLSIKLRTPPQGACCNKTQRVPKERWDRGCVSIDIPVKDRFYSQFGIVCSQFTRAQTSDESGCPLPEFEQENSVTSLLDASVVYGAEDSVTQQLRSFQYGKLKYEITSDGRMFLPHQVNATTSCFVETNKAPCFLGSDFRVNQHPHLSIFQVVLLRVHNKLCEELISINANNPNWNKDEIIFQEAKRIVTGILQNIFFGRYAEILLGKDCAAAYGITPSGCPEQPYDTGYDCEVNPATMAEFQNVASRSLHSLVEGVLRLYDQNRVEVGAFRLSDWFFNPALVLEPGIFDQMLMGIVTQVMQGFDRFYSVEITEQLFKQLNNNLFGTDLAAIDIMRGRDCGMQPYIYFATLAGFPVVNTFDELTDRMDPKMIERLRSQYKTVADIDSLIGCILEYRFGQSLVGKTLHTIFAEQLRRYKYGDSHFFTFKGPGQFRPEQLNAIKSAGLSFLMCYGSDALQSIQRDAFTLSDNDPPVPCQTIIDEFLQQLRQYWVEN